MNNRISIPDRIERYRISQPFSLLTKRERVIVMCHKHLKFTYKELQEELEVAPRDISNAIKRAYELYPKEMEVLNTIGERRTK